MGWLRRARLFLGSRLIGVRDWMEVARSRGQFTVVGLVMVFITIIVYAGLYPVLTDVISDAQFTGATKMIADLMPFMFLIAILLALLAYTTPHREQY